MTLEAVLKEAMSLSPRERAALADKLWRSVPHDESELALTPEQARDLDRRVAEDEAGKSGPRDWDQVRDELRRQK
jgi:putative addiction module component (TIGR02574 family)